MNEPIIIENNSGGFAMLGKLLGNRAFLGMLVVVLVSWRVHDWWYREDVCLQRYDRANKTFQKESARKNARTQAVEKRSTSLDSRNEKKRAQKLRRVNDLADRHETDATLPAQNHGAIQDVR